MQFTIEKIEEAWKEYREKKMLRILQNGKWVVKALGAQPLTNIEGTSAEVCPIHRLMSFPKFLKTYYG